MMCKKELMAMVEQIPDCYHLDLPVGFEIRVNSGYAKAEIGVRDKGKFIHLVLREESEACTHAGQCMHFESE